MKGTLFFALSSMALLAGCGSLGDPAKREPLAVIEGQLTQSTQTTPPAANQVRVAIVWPAAGEAGTGFSAAQDVAVTPVFPSRFRLELTERPPESALRTEANSDVKADAGQSHFAAALGALVAYEDVNGNGKLDLSDDPAQFVDRILGTNESLLVVYVEGTLPRSPLTDAIGAPPPGYSFMHDLPCDPGVRCTGFRKEWLSTSTPYDLTLSADPRLAKMMCSKGGFGSGPDLAVSTTPIRPVPGPGPDGKYPAKDDPQLHCNSDGLSYYYTKETTISHGLCKGATLHLEVSLWTMPTTPQAGPPPGWPCDVK